MLASSHTSARCSTVGLCGSQNAGRGAGGIQMILLSRGFCKRTDSRPCPRRRQRRKCRTVHQFFNGGDGWEGLYCQRAREFNFAAVNAAFFVDNIEKEFTAARHGAPRRRRTRLRPPGGDTDFLVVKPALRCRLPGLSKQKNGKQTNKHNPRYSFQIHSPSSLVSDMQNVFVVIDNVRRGNTVCEKTDILTGLCERLAFVPPASFLEKNEADMTTDCRSVPS